jgi:hypothetical protein
MDRPNAGERAPAGASPTPEIEAMEFVRFCHRRRRVGWPELYDEMCAVAGRGLYRGFGQDDLASIGIGLGLFQMPALAGLVARVVEEDLERRRRTAAAVEASLIADEASLAAIARTPAQEGALDRDLRHAARDTAEVVGPEIGSMRIAVPAGA